MVLWEKKNIIIVFLDKLHIIITKYAPNHSPKKKKNIGRNKTRKKIYQNFNLKVASISMITLNDL